jgi:Polyketide cyclase / dehydrase and lipid transport
MAAYHFDTHWRFQAPLDAVWKALMNIEGYPQWWPCFRECKKLDPGPTVVGSRFLRVVHGRLPYTMRTVMTITQIDAPRAMAYSSTGDLVGTGAMTFSQDGEWTDVQLPWDTQTTSFWMNLLAPLLRGLYRRNHDWVLAQGQIGLAQWLKENSGDAARPSTQGA